MQNTDQISNVLNQLKGRSDRDILSSVESAGGMDATLDVVFQGMVDAFVPERASGQEAVIQYDIATPKGTVSYQLDVRGGSCRAQRGAVSTPRIKLALSLPNFLRLSMGTLGPTSAFLTGKLKLSGDMLLSAQLERWFERPN